MANHKECLRGIRRPSRLGAVWLSYRTHRGLIALTSIVGIAFAVIAWNVWIFDPDSNLSAEPPEPSPAPIASFHPDWTHEKIDWKHLRSFTVHEPHLCEQLWTPGAIPRLEALTVFSALTDKQLADLCQLYDLKALTFLDARDLSADGFNVLGNETSLEYLNVMGFDPLNGGTSPLHDNVVLNWPPNLRVLKCDDTRGIPLHRLREWKHLRHLECLCTRLQYRHSDERAEIIDVIEGYPRLRRLYTVDLERFYPIFEFAQSKLSKVRLRPNSYNPAPGRRIAFILVGGVLVILLTSVQFSTYFATTASVLTPHFRSSHATPMIGVVVTLFLTSFGLTWLTRCSSATAAGLCGVAAFACACVVRGLRFIHRIDGNQLPGFIGPPTIFPIAALPVIGIVLVIAIAGAEFDWFLRGHHIWICPVLFVGSLWGAFDLIRGQMDIARDLEAVGGNVPLNTLSFNRLSEWETNLAEKRSNTKPKFNYQAFDARMDRFIARRQAGKPITSFELWRYGSEGLKNERQRRVFGILFIPMFVFCQSWFSGQMNLMVNLWTAFFQWSAIEFGLVGMFTIKRASIQELELLRPLSRHDWMGIWFLTSAKRWAPFVLFGVFLCLISPLFGQSDKWTLSKAILSSVEGTAVAGIFFAAMMIILTYASGTLTSGSVTKVVGVVLFCFALSFLMILNLANVVDNGFELNTVIPSIVGLYLIAYFGLKLAWWRWQNWEVGHVE